ncbi:MAG: DUF1800 domain-containing protein [Candidatus Acidiferrales bacterium]
MIPRCEKCLVAFSLALILTLPVFPQSAPLKVAKKPTPAVFTERQRAIQALNRLTFGPRPGDVEAVLQKGVDDWIEDQLHPESLDDSALNARLGPYATTRMNPKQLAETFPSDTVIRQVMAGKRTMPDEPAAKLIYAVNVARIKQQEGIKAQNANTTAAGGNSKDSKPTEDDPAKAQSRAIADSLLALPKNQRLAALENAPPDQLINFPSQLRGDQRDRLLAEATPQERELIFALANPAGVAARELQQAKLIREVYSERQLLEVMTDFWFNHFNVFLYKNQCSYYTTAYERDVIRPHALGKFYDLLAATAQSPAMLMYLDNWLSIGPHSQAAGKNGGLNENYAREVMELHTLGVDGGYTQADVTELARVLTGWTIVNPDDGGQFQFDARRHEPGVKTVLGEKIYESGVDEGIKALEMLAHHPSTAKCISRSLAVRFVSDDPPQALVDQMTAKFSATDGDIREVLRTMIRSPEFWSPKAYGNKMKTPLDLVVSAVRASGANVVSPDSLVDSLSGMGMQPYGMAVPTGYSMKSAQWDNEGGLLARMNFSTSLTQGNLPGVQFDPSTLITLGVLTSLNEPHAKAVLAEKPAGMDFAIALAEDAMLPAGLLPKDEAVIRKQAEDPEPASAATASMTNRLRFVTGFILASPEFQHR